MVVTGGERRELLGAVGQLAGVHQALGGGRPLQRAQPALVVAPALPGRMGRVPVADLADQRPAEVFPVDQAGLAEGQRQAKRPALPRRGKHQLAVVTWRCRGPGGVEEAGRVGVSSGTGHGAHPGERRERRPWAHRILLGEPPFSIWGSLSPGRQDAPAPYTFLDERPLAGVAVPWPGHPAQEGAPEPAGDLAAPLITERDGTTSRVSGLPSAYLLRAVVRPSPVAGA